jgi:hypothetical protein
MKQKAKRMNAFFYFLSFYLVSFFVYRTLSQIQHRNQHDKQGGYPQYFSPNILKHYLLVHDVFSGISDTDAQNLFTQVATSRIRIQKFYFS